MERASSCIEPNMFQTCAETVVVDPFPMSTKVEICGFSGHTFHAGHGRIHVREDKHLMAFESRKAFRMWER